MKSRQWLALLGAAARRVGWFGSVFALSSGLAGCRDFGTRSTSGGPSDSELGGMSTDSGPTFPDATPPPSEGQGGAEGSSGGTGNGADLGDSATSHGDAGPDHGGPSEAGSGAPDPDGAGNGGAPDSGDVATGPSGLPEAGVDGIPDSGDAEAFGPRCDPKAPFQDIAEVPALNIRAVNHSMRLSADELTVYFDSFSEIAALAVWKATRPTKVAPWGEPTRVEFPGLTSQITSLSISDDGLSVYFSHLSTKFKTYVASRKGRESEFETPMFLKPINDMGSIARIFVLPDESEMYVVVAAHLHRSLRGTQGWGAPQVLAQFGERVVTAVLTEDGNTMYVSLNHTIYRASRETRSAQWGLPRVVPELADGKLSEPSWISDDDCVLYFSRDYRAYSATRGRGRFSKPPVASD